MNKFLVLFLVGFFLLGCKKNPKTEQPIDPCDPNSNIVLETEYPVIYYPVVNPENPDELAFLRDNSLSSCCDVEIMVYNQSTEELKSIHTESVSNIEWGNGSWLFFDNIETQIVSKIKPNGDSLTRIQANYGLFNPKFNFDRTAFLAHFHTPDFSENGYMILSQTGAEIKIIDDTGLASYNNWHHDSLVLIVDKFSQEDNLFLGLYSTNETINEPFPLRSGTFLDDKSSLLVGSEWLDDKRLIVSTQNGLNLIEFSGLNYVASPIQWRSTCSLTAYGKVSVDRIHQKIIVERQSLEEVETGKFISRNRFYRMNFDGSGEELIEINGL